MTCVLVAVYNAEKTLRKCLDSLLSQTLKEVQIICIDDASTDSSLSILNNYASKHSNIEVIALQENHGQAYARNQGIPLIKGEYTAFLDSDDFLEPTALETIENVFREDADTDCVLFDVQYLYHEGITKGYRTKIPEVISGYDACIKALTWNIHGWYVARTELYKKYPFDETCHSYSDDNVTMEHFYHSRKVRSSKAKYFFVQTDNSCTRGISIHLFDWLRANESLHKKLLSWNMPQDIIDLYERVRYYNLLSITRTYLRHQKSFTTKQHKLIKDELKYAWKNIDTSSLPFNVKFKPAYFPLHPFWNLFYLQEWLYAKLIK